MYQLALPIKKTVSSWSHNKPTRWRILVQSSVEINKFNKHFMLSNTYPGLIDHVNDGDETSLQGTSRAFRNATSLYKSLEGLQLHTKTYNYYCYSNYDLNTKFPYTFSKLGEICFQVFRLWKYADKKKTRCVLPFSLYLFCDTCSAVKCKPSANCRKTALNYPLLLHEINTWIHVIWI